MPKGKKNKNNKGNKNNGRYRHRDFRQVGVVIDNVGSSQVSYLAITKSNEAIDNNPLVNLALFVSSLSIPCVQVRVPRFHVKDATTFDGWLIMTTVDAAIAVKNCTRAKKCYYINDIEWSRAWFKHPDAISSIMTDPAVVKVFRSKDHMAFAAKTWPHLSECVVIKDFEIPTFLEMFADVEKKQEMARAGRKDFQTADQV
jgi:hypothetical protein